MGACRDLFSAQRKRIDGPPPRPPKVTGKESEEGMTEDRDHALSPLFCRSSVAVRHDTRPRCFVCRPECCLLFVYISGIFLDSEARQPPPEGD
jgi:hypothetical protein